MSSFQSSILYSLILATLGYFIITFMDFSNDASILFAVGIALGGAFIAIITNSSANNRVTKSSKSQSKQNDIETKTIYVGNLPYRANETAIRELFEQYGHVQSVRLLKDRQTGKRRGFGFVEMDANCIKQTITALNESEFQQRTLKVREAKDRADKVSNDELQTQT